MVATVAKLSESHVLAPTELHQGHELPAPRTALLSNGKIEPSAASWKICFFGLIKLTSGLAHLRASGCNGQALGVIFVARHNSKVRRWKSATSYGYTSSLLSLLPPLLYSKPYVMRISDSNYHMTSCPDSNMATCNTTGWIKERLLRKSMAIRDL